MKKDTNTLASQIVEQATGQSIPDTAKNPNAVALGRLGGLKGGKARASKLSPEQRKEMSCPVENGWRLSEQNYTLY